MDRMSFQTQQKGGLLIKKAQRGSVATNGTTQLTTPVSTVPASDDGKFLRDALVDPGFNADARAKYYAQRIDSANFGNQIGTLNRLREQPVYKANPTRLADSLLAAPNKTWRKFATPERQREVLGDEQFADWMSITKGLPGSHVNKNTYYTRDSVKDVRAGDTDPDAALWGIRSALSMQPAQRGLRDSRYYQKAVKTYDPHDTKVPYKLEYSVTPVKKADGGALNTTWDFAMPKSPVGKRRPRAGLMTRAQQMAQYKRDTGKTSLRKASEVPGAADKKVNNRHG